MSKGKVLVTGVTGYIGSWVCREFLDAGFEVRGTVRNKAKKVKHLEEWIAKGQPLELFEIDLLASPEEWAKAVEGCTFIAHTASPFFTGCPPEEAEERLFKPAKRGTLNVLEGALAAGGVKRVVVTSSVAAVMGGREDPPLLKEPEKVWSIIEKSDPYSASKTMAERAAWDLVVETKEAGKDIFELATVNPCLVVGPPLSAGWATSHEVPRRLVNREMPGVPNMHMGTVDVRDVALAHRLAMECDLPEDDPREPLNRFIVQGQSTPLPKWARLLAEEFRPYGYKVPTRTLPYALLWVASFFDSSIKMILGRVGKGAHDVDCARAKEVLGLTFREEKDSLVDHVHACLRLGVDGFKVTPKYQKFLDEAGPLAAASE